jgi:flavin-dependent dehydrogenase
VSADAVVIAGGGPAGLAAAIRLRRYGVKVAVVERDVAPRARIGESVPADLRAVLQALGAWPAFRAQEHLPSSGRASAWETADLRRSDALCAPLGGGWHLDRRRFEAMLEREAIRAGAALLRGAALSRADLAGARVVIDATGRAGTVARWHGARRRVHDRLICTHAVFGRGERAAAARRTLVEAVEDGWWYATPVPGGGALAALFGDASTFRARGYRRRGAWHEALQRTLHVFAYVDRPRPPDALEVSAVTPHCLDRPVGRDWIAIGDAACSLDPLASAGITLALRDGLRAADAVKHHLDGDPLALQAHARDVRRRFAQHLRERGGFYDLRHRWPDSAFWRERAGASTTRGSSRRAARLGA